MADLSAFSESYPEARAKFLDAAGAHVRHYDHPQKGLFLDVATIGDAQAPHVFAVGCGTHGIEGYSGSGALVHWLRSGVAKRLPRDTAVVAFHAHNPWGFANRTRVTEENVDLNRNFVDFSRPRPANPHYAEVHEIVTPQRWDEETVAEVFRKLAAFKARVGEQAFSDAYNGGQYTHADGLFYGGARAQWGNSAFRRAVTENLGHARKAAFMDLHTGIGPRYGHVYLTFAPSGSPAYARARAWWGDRAVNREGVTHKAVAVYRGVLLDAFAEMLPQAEVTTIVVEFGTLAREGMQRAGMLQRWMRFEGPRHPERLPALQREYDEAFYPSEPRWREAVLAQSLDFLERGARGVSAS